MCSDTPADEALNLIRQAYESIAHSKTTPNPWQPLIKHLGLEAVQGRDTHRAKLTVTQIDSLYQLSQVGGRFSKQPAWLDILARAVADLPKGCQAAPANRLLAAALRKAGLHVVTQMNVSPRSAHSVDFVISSVGDKVGVEFGTGRAERVELDLLKVMILALQRDINCACLILPMDVARPRVLGGQNMPTAVRWLGLMCSPLFGLIQRQLADVFVMWYA